MADKFSGDRANSASALGSQAVKYIPADADLPINVKAVVFDADGTMDYKNSTGSTITGYPIVKGIPPLFVPTRIITMTGPTNCFLIS